MSAKHFEIRHCQNSKCGLRYPLVEKNSFGERCPICLDDTKVIITQTFPVFKNQSRLNLPKKRIKYALIDNVRSAANVGAIFRTSDGFGLEKLFLCGITPTPENKGVQKTSMRTENNVAWDHSPNAVEIAIKLKSEGIALIALEQDTRAVRLTEIPDLSPHDVVLIVGNEVVGVDPGVLDECDQIINIPMYGTVSSFNVVTAFSIALFSMANPAQ